VSAFSIERLQRNGAIAIIAPAGRDAKVIHQTLSSNGVDCRIVSPHELADGIETGELAGAILSEEALERFDHNALLRAIDRQPPWSDFPIVLLTFKGTPSHAGSSAVERLGHVSLLERPLHSSALLSAARAILRTRSRQREMEGFLRQREEAHANLQALNNLQELFERAPGCIAVTLEREHRFEMANSALRGLARRDLIGRTVADVLPEFIEHGILEILDRVYDTGQPFTTEEFQIRLRNPEGQMEERFFTLFCQPLLTTGGKVKGLFAEGFDVTHQKTAQDRVQILQNELIHMSRLSAMGAMASTLSHELNQPLMAIANYSRAGARLLEQGGAVALDQVKFAISQAEKSALRAGDIIRSARDMVAGGRTYREHLELGHLVREALELAIIGATDSGLVCHTSYEPDTCVLVDRVQIQQVILNIVRNAIEAMDGLDRRELSVCTKASEAIAEVVIADTGRGLDPQVRERLFMPFTTSKKDGLGVGLSISRTIIEAHGGTIEAGECAGGGTIMSFKLPLAIRPTGTQQGN
jgi:C4-dicarboxylate-specific signal transduction histidine kinase